MNQNFAYIIKIKIMLLTKAHWSRKLIGNGKWFIFLVAIIIISGVMRRKLSLPIFLPFLLV